MGTQRSNMGCLTGSEEKKEEQEKAKGGGGGNAEAGPFDSLFGKTILTKDGEKPTSEALAGKTHVVVYFSAHWCPPCRGYTPELSKAYADSAKAGKETAIVFVSSDQDQAGFDSYYGEMSFYAMPFAERDLKAMLSEKYKVNGIPSLVLLDGSGQLVDGGIRGKHANYL